MLLREWVYQRMASDPVLEGIVGDRIVQGESVVEPIQERTRVPAVKPFLVYRMGNASAHNGLRQARYQYLTIYAHDEAYPGDYTQIDQMTDALINLFGATDPVPAYKLLECRWLETSADFDDREMGTILRYSRFQLVTSQWT